MKAFLTSLCAVVLIAVASHFLLAEGMLLDRSAATVYSSPNVRLGDPAD